MNKIALITGATSGIGKSTALIFAQNKYNVIITGRRKNLLDELTTEIKSKYNVEILALNFDVRDKNEVEKHLGNLPKEWENIDVLVNNAGLALGINTLQDANTDDWERMIDTNVKGLLYVSKVISNKMIKNQKGHIINIGSIAGRQNYGGNNAYCATKHAVESITQTLRIDLLPYNIRVSSVNPGAAETEFSVVRFNGDKNKADKVYEGYQPLTPDDIADTIYYVASRPAHVCINDVLIMPTAQANVHNVFKK